MQTIEADSKLQGLKIMVVDDSKTIRRAAEMAEISLGSALLFAPTGLRGKVGLLAATFFTAIFPGNIAQAVHHKDAFGLDTDAKRDRPALRPAAARGLGALVDGRLGAPREVAAEAALVRPGVALRWLSLSKPGEPTCESRPTHEVSTSSTNETDHDHTLVEPVETRRADLRYESTTPWRVRLQVTSGCSSEISCRPDGVRS